MKKKIFRNFSKNILQTIVQITKAKNSFNVSTNKIEKHAHCVFRFLGGACFIKVQKLVNKIFQKNFFCKNVLNLNEYASKWTGITFFVISV